MAKKKKSSILNSIVGKIPVIKENPPVQVQQVDSSIKSSNWYNKNATISLTALNESNTVYQIPGDFVIYEVYLYDNGPGGVGYDYIFGIVDGDTISSGSAVSGSASIVLNYSSVFFGTKLNAGGGFYLYMKRTSGGATALSFNLVLKGFRLSAYNPYVSTENVLK